MAKAKNLTSVQVMKRLGVRSGLEAKACQELEAAGIEYEYEKHKIEYEIHTNNKYTPDFKICDTFYETKGLWDTKDRMKMRYIKEQHPDLKIILVFQDSNKKIAKGSKTSYAMYCDKYGLAYMDYKFFIPYVRRYHGK